MPTAAPAAPAVPAAQPQAAQPVAPTPAPPAKAPTAAQPKAETSVPGLLGGISISNLKQVQPAMPRLQAEVKPLTQDDLERYWAEVADELNLKELMAGGKPRVGERTGCIEIDAQNTYFHDEFKAHRIDVMEALRAKCGMPMLDCKVNQLFLEKDEVVYSPNDKYNAMLEQNPNLVLLRKLFPQIDY